MSRWARDRERFWGAPVPPGRRHGPNTWTKSIYGCGCHLCLPSGKRRSPNGQGKPKGQVQREHHARYFGTPVPEGRHGWYGYQTCGCRCDECKAWKATASAEVKARQKERVRASWHGHWYDDVERGVTVLHWPPRDLDEPWLCPICDYKVMP